MKVQHKVNRQTRREFLKQAGCMGAWMCLAADRLFSQNKAGQAAAVETGVPFRFRTVAVGHVQELKSWMDQLDKAGKLSANKTWRRYVGSFQYAPPATLPNARSLVIMATPLLNTKIVFNASGRKYSILIPSGYVDDGLKTADYQNMLYQNGVVSKDSKLERARLPLKQLAVRSGLAMYGKNNIAYVDGYGSFHQLLAFYSEQKLPDHWGGLKMLRLCKGCSICTRECPTGAIHESSFVITHEKCITLYNELSDPLPDWIPAKAHNTLIGCLKCQKTCPGNEDLQNDFWDLGEVNETETAALLSGKIDSEMEHTLKIKLQRIGGGDDLGYIARNLKLVLKAQKS